MTEPTLAFIASLKLVWATVFAFLYARGGMTWKVWRRYIAPTWLLLGLIGFSLWAQTFSWPIVIAPLLLVGALHLGYGAHTTGAKLKRRGLYALAVSVMAVPLILTGHTYWLGLLHLGLCSTVTISLGVFNIARSARDEETIIGFVISFLPLFMV